MSPGRASSIQRAMPDSDPLRWDAPTIAAAVQAGRADPVEVIDAFLGQIHRANPAVNALVDHDEAAPRAEAAGLRRRVAAGEALPLAGVPVAVKDSIWVAGRRITQGSPLFRDFRPVRDALPVERMRRAGAVVIGIGNMPEFGAKEVTDNRLYGRTLNPRDLSRTPGGSSGGCAAALAADMAAAALGGDGGGSCRRPPAHVGAVGFKPSSGVVADPWGFPGTLPGIACTCPMGRTVADTQALFTAVAGAHPADPLSQNLALPEPVLPEPALIGRLRVAYSPQLGLGLPLDADVRAAVGRSRRHAVPPRPGGRGGRSGMAARHGGGAHPGHRGRRACGPVRREVACRAGAVRSARRLADRARPGPERRRGRSRACFQPGHRVGHRSFFRQLGPAALSDHRLRGMDSGPAGP